MRVLTTECDTLPGRSPDGRRVGFTRRTSATSFDVFTIRPDGTGLARLTARGTDDGHAVWTRDGSGKRVVTDSLWEDSMPLLVPARFP